MGFQAVHVRHAMTGMDAIRFAEPRLVLAQGLDRGREVLDELDKREVHLVTVTNVMGHGRQKGEAEVYRGHKEAGRLLRKVKLEVAVNDDYVQPTIDAIVGGARSDGGKIGDGEIFVFDLSECVRIRTGEKGSDAIG